MRTHVSFMFRAFDLYVESLKPSFLIRYISYNPSYSSACNQPFLHHSVPKKKCQIIDEYGFGAFKAIIPRCVGDSTSTYFWEQLMREWLVTTQTRNVWYMYICFCHPYLQYTLHVGLCSIYIYIHWVIWVWWLLLGLALSQSNLFFSLSIKTSRNFKPKQRIPRAHNILWLATPSIFVAHKNRTRTQTGAPHISADLTQKMDSQPL